MRNLTRLTITALITCLTISQSGWAQTAPKAKPQAKKQQVRFGTGKATTTTKSSSAFAEPPPLEETWASEARVKIRKEEGIIGGTAQSVLQTLPGKGDLIVEAGIAGSNSSMSGSRRSNIGGFGETDVTVDAKEDGMSGNLAVTYGLTENFYFGVNGTYSNSQSSSDGRAAAVGMKTTSKAEKAGFEEPSVMGGYQKLLGTTRLALEIHGQIPTGNQKSTVEASKTTGDSKSGGGSFGPKLSVISEVGGVRLLGQLGYTVQDERKESVEDKTTGTNDTRTITGGNSVNVAAGLELPQAHNLGLMGLYSQTEESKTASSLTAGTSISGVRSVVGAAAYLGIELGRNTLLMPRLVYGTVLEKEADNIKLDKVEVWNFGLGTKIMF